MKDPNFTLDSTEDIDNGPNSIKYGCRIPLYCVPIPGETEWVRSANPVFTSPLTTRSQADEKIQTQPTTKSKINLRQLGETPSIIDNDPSKIDFRHAPLVRNAPTVQLNSFSTESSNTCTNAPSHACSSSYSDLKLESSLNEGESVPEGVTLTSTGAQVFSAHLSDSVDALRGSMLALDEQKKQLNLPHGVNMDLKGCPQSFIVYVVDDEEKYVNNLRIHDCIYVEGNLIMQNNNGSSNSTDSNTLFDENEDVDMGVFDPLSSLPWSLVPRILTSSVLKLDNANIHNSLSPPQHPSASESPPPSRSAVSECFHAVLGGDLLGEQALFSLLGSSSSSEWCEGQTPRGHLPVLLLDVSSSDADLLVSLLQNLLPCVVRLRVNVQTLNEAVWTPFKDYESNRIIAGRFQIPHHAVIVLDETQLDPGHINKIGTANLSAVRRLIEDLVIQVPFGPSEVTFPLNGVKILGLAGRNSLFQSSFALSVPVSPLHHAAATAPPPSLPLLNSARSFLSHYVLPQSSTGVEISAEVAREVEKVFVEERSIKRDETISENTLHTWLSIAKGLASVQEISSSQSLNENAKGKYFMMDVDCFRASVDVWRGSLSRMKLRLPVVLKGKAGDEIDLDD